MLQGTELGRAIAGHHLRSLSEQQKQIVRLRGDSVRPDAIAGQLHLSASHVRKEVGRLVDLIVIPLGGDHDGWICGRWCDAHRECCL